MRRLLLGRALLPNGATDDVRVSIEGGRFIEVEPGVGADSRRVDERIGGLVVPGLANCHSHAFHRALRGRTQAERGSFWTWRERMYAVAERLDPDTYYMLARATYAEMLAAGFTSVGEFHYLHHRPDGGEYDDANAMGLALIAAARDVGLRITLLDTCYLSSGFGRPPEGTQLRYSDRTADSWADRVSALSDSDGVCIGAAVHSVRAVPADQLPVVASAATGRPLHVHLSEQVAENKACLDAHGCTPARLLADAGCLGPMTSAVHATHLTEADVARLAVSFACFCPTTERDLGDGIGPSRELAAAGARLTVGTDSHAVIDAFEELRAVELDERLATRSRGHWSAPELLCAGGADGQASLGWPDSGRIEVGARADLVVLDSQTPSLAGTAADEAAVVFAATASDVRRTMVDGHWRYQGDRATIGAGLNAAIGAIL